MTTNLTHSRHKFKENQGFDSEKNITLPFKLELAWQGFKSYIPELEDLLNRKLYRLEKLQEKDPFSLSEREIKSIQYLQREIQTLYNIYVAMCHFRETVAFELERKIQHYESKINYLQTMWRGASDTMLLFKDYLTVKNSEK